MSSTSNAPLQQEQSFLYFRVCIGGMCIVFLVVLLVGRMIFDSFGVMNSISDYYYSPSMHNVFVGGLCILGALLMCYRYEEVDTVASFLAGICAICVALFPKAPDPKSSECPLSNMNCPTELQIGMGVAHWVSAAFFLLIIAFIVLALFTQSSAPKPTKPSKKYSRNMVYKWTGSLMVVSVLLCGLVQLVLLPRLPELQKVHPIFWCELLSLGLFIGAWIVKGQMLLWDNTQGESTLLGIFSYIHYAVGMAITSFRAIFPTKSQVSSDIRTTVAKAIASFRTIFQAKGSTD